MAHRYRVISADSHLEISPDRWTGRIPARYRDRAPRLVKLATGGDGVMVENRSVYVLGLAVTGKPYKEHRIYGVTYDGSPGTGTPEQRLEEQDQDGVDAEVMFTSTRNAEFWRGIRDDNAYKAVVHAYNEFLAEEYCAPARDRLLAMGMIPLTGLDDAIAEMEYCARAGLQGVALGAFPSGKGYPTPEDDRFYAAALDLDIPVTAHVGFVQQPGPLFPYQRKPVEAGFGSEPVELLTRFGGGIAQNAIQLIMAGVFDRFPKLRIYWAETMVGWLGYCYEELDDTYNRIRHWARREFGLEPLKRPPSDYLREHCLWGFLRDPFGVRHRHEAGVGNIMWGSDFPHYVGDWPHSLKMIDELFAGVPEEERYQIVAGNAIQFFHLENESRGPDDRPSFSDANGSAGDP